MRELASIRSLTRLAPLTRGTAERSYREAVTFNAYVRPGTWVTNQTGHIGYTLRLSFAHTTSDLWAAELPISRSVSTWFKSHEGRCRHDDGIFDHAGDPLTTRRALSPVGVA